MWREKPEDGRKKLHEAGQIIFELEKTCSIEYLALVQYFFIFKVSPKKYTIKQNFLARLIKLKAFCSWASASVQQVRGLMYNLLCEIGESTRVINLCSQWTINNLDRGHQFINTLC